jgi:hypothetical protein
MVTKTSASMVRPRTLASSWELHGGATYTWQSTFFSFNLYNVAADTASGLYKALNWLIK